MSVTLPATTSPFEAADIFARASGYIERRNVDIGSRVRAGDLLAVITAPELDHQIVQAEASLAQAKATHRQTKAKRELGQVTWARDATLVNQGWVTQQQGDTDRLNYAAQQQAVRAETAAIASQEAQLAVLRQQKAYQQVVAPFDGVVTRRNIDVGSLVQADATSGTFMFTLTQNDVLRIRLYVPQDAAIGVKPGVDAAVRVVWDGLQATQFFDDADADENAPCLDLVLLDMNLPKKRVDEVLRHLRGSVKCRDAKVLIVSSSGEALDRAAVAGFAVVGYFKKPVNYTDFMTLRPFVRGFLNSPTDNPPSGIF